MKLPDFEAWAIFAKVAETGSFNGAAEALGLSTPTVSKAVSRLEERIGARLFNRTSRKLSLTEAGRLAREDAARILAEGEAAEARAMAATLAPQGLVRLAVPMSFGIRHVAPLLPGFFARYPEVSVDLHLADAVVDLVGDGFDIGLRIADLPDSSLRTRRICAVQRSLVAAPAYLDARGRPRHPADLADHGCLGYAYLPSPDRWRFVSISGEEATIVPRGQLRANNAEALTPSLLAGLGLAVQPHFLVHEHLENGELERVLPDWTLPPIALHIVTPPGEPRPARITVLIDYLVEALAAAPWARERFGAAPTDPASGTRKAAPQA